MSMDLGYLLEVPGGLSISGADPAATQLDVYGEDVLFTDDLQLTPKGDYQTVKGTDNLRRAVLRRLLVRPGEHKLNPKYGAGVPSFVKKAQTKANLDELKHAIVDQLSRERRIQKVLSISVTATLFGDQPGIVVDLQVQAIGRNISFQPFSFTSSGVL